MEVAGAWASAHHYDCRCRLDPLKGSGARLPAGYFSSGGFALAALLEPRLDASALEGVRAGGAAAIAEIGMILVLAGIISLTGQQILRFCVHGG